MRVVAILAMPQQLIVLLLLFHATAAPAGGQRAGCPSKCGEVDIPFPFGVGVDCALPGLNVSCNHSFAPPRPYIADDNEFIDVSLETGETRVYTPVLQNCFDLSNTSSSSDAIWQGLDLTGTPFLVSPERNEFTATGCDTLGMMYGREDGSYLTGCVTTCASLDAAANDGDHCAGLGCCQIDPVHPWKPYLTRDDVRDDVDGQHHRHEDFCVEHLPLRLYNRARQVRIVPPLF